MYIYIYIYIYSSLSPPGLGSSCALALCHGPGACGGGSPALGFPLLVPGLSPPGVPSPGPPPLPGHPVLEGARAGGPHILVRIYLIVS